MTLCIEEVEEETQCRSHIKSGSERENDLPSRLAQDGRLEKTKSQTLKYRNTPTDVCVCVCVCVFKGYSSFAVLHKVEETD